MANTVRVNADHGRDFHPLADHRTKLRNFTKGEIREFSAFPFSLYLTLDQTLSNLIVCLMKRKEKKILKGDAQTS